MSVNQLNLMSQLIDYEAGILEEDDMVELFENLYETGLLWQLQGHYQRTFQDLVDSGSIVMGGLYED